VDSHLVLTTRDILKYPPLLLSGGMDTSYPPLGHYVGLFTVHKNFDTAVNVLQTFS